MSIFETIVQGIVQGATEFLPSQAAVTCRLHSTSWV